MLSLCCLLALQFIFGTANAQLDKKITIPYQHPTGIQLVNLVKQQTNYVFSFDEILEKRLRGIVIIKNNSATINDIMGWIGNSLNLTFKQVGTTLVLAAVPARPVIKKRPLVVGRIVDIITGDAMAGASIAVKGRGIGAISDSTGHFSITIADMSKTYTLVITSSGFNPSEVVAHGGDDLIIKMAYDGKSLQGVVVTAKKKNNSERSVLAERKNSVIIQDAISAQNIEKTASITTTQALQRVSGVTVTNDKYVSIRGIGDRTVVGQINGARIAAANADNNSVPMDLVPAGLLENIAVFKTVTPDKPADATAGIVELRTKSFPDTLTVTFTAQVGTNSTVGFGGEINSFYDSKLGFLGDRVKTKNLSDEFFKLSSQYPQKGVISTGAGIRQFMLQSRSLGSEAVREANRVNVLMKEFSPVLTTQHKTASPNQIYSVGFGNKYRFGKNQTLGIVAGLNYYSRSEARRDAELSDWSIYQGVGYRYHLYIPPSNTANNVMLNDKLHLTENTGTETLNYGGLIGIGYRPATGQEISFNYIGNKGAENQGTKLIGDFPSAGTDRPVLNQVYSLRQEERRLNVYQARGQHKFARGQYAPQFNWNASISKSLQNNPDYRFTSVIIDSNYYDYLKQKANTNFYSFLTGTRAAVVSGAQLYDPNNRAYRTLHENNQNYQADFSLPFKVKSVKQVFKTGYFYLRKSRDYTENILSLPSDAALTSTKGDLDKIVAYDQVGLLNGISPTNEGLGLPAGFIYDVAKTMNNYSGSSTAQAAYGMVELGLGDKFKFAGGVRFEKTDMHALLDTAGTVTLTSGQFNSILQPVKYAEGFNPNISYKTKWLPYYSGTLIYSPQKQLNVRLSYSKTLARPELRELIPITQYDPFQFAIVSGNPNLQNQITHAFDFRAEYFAQAGEVFSISLYSKTIYNQLNKVFTNDSSGTTASGYEFNQVKFYNDPEKGHILGIELEGRKSLGFISRHLKHLFLGTNLLLADSYTFKNKERLAQSRLIDNYAPDKSPLLYQPSYSLNVFLDYENPATGTNITTSFNQLGERLVQVVLTGEPDIYDQPVPVLDFVFKQRLFKKWALKGYAKNVLDPTYKEVYSNYGNNGKFHGREYIRKSYHRGAEYLMGVTYDLF